jgi:hypothetical protein
MKFGRVRCLAISIAIASSLGCNAIEHSATPNSDYIILQENDSLSDYVDRSVVLEGTLAEIPLQHMMRSSPDRAESHFYFNPDERYNIGQLVAYYRNDTLQFDRDRFEGRTFTLYGTVGVISGAGKGKTGTHVEHFILVDRVEE